MKHQLPDLFAYVLADLQYFDSCAFTGETEVFQINQVDGNQECIGQYKETFKQRKQPGWYREKSPDGKQQQKEQVKGKQDGKVKAKPHTKCIHELRKGTISIQIGVVQVKQYPAKTE